MENANDTHVILQRSDELAVIDSVAESSATSADNDEQMAEGRDGKREEHVEEQETDLTMETNSTSVMEDVGDISPSVSSCSVLDASRDMDGSNVQMTEGPEGAEEVGGERKSTKRMENVQTGIATPKRLGSKLPVPSSRLPKPDPKIVKKKAINSSPKPTATVLAKTIKPSTPLKRKDVSPMVTQKENKEEPTKEMNTPDHKTTPAPDSEHCHCEHSRQLAIRNQVISKENVKINSELINEKAKREAAEMEQKNIQDKLKPIQEMYARKLNDNRILRMKADDAIKLQKRNKELREELAKANEDLSKAKDELAEANSDLEKSRAEHKMEEKKMKDQVEEMELKIKEVRETAQRNAEGHCRLQVEKKMKDQVEEMEENYRFQVEEAKLEAEEKLREEAAILEKGVQQKIADGVRQRVDELEETFRQKSFEAQQMIEEAEHIMRRAKEDRSEAMKEGVKLAKMEKIKMTNERHVVRGDLLEPEESSVTKIEGQILKQAVQAVENAKKIEETARQEVAKAHLKVEELEKIIDKKQLQTNEENEQRMRELEELRQKDEQYEQKILENEERIQEYEQKILENEERIQENEERIQEYEQRIQENEERIQEYEELKHQELECRIQELEELQHMGEEFKQMEQQLREMKEKNEEYKQRIQEFEEFVIEQDTEMVWEPDTKVSQLEAELSAHVSKEAELTEAIQEANAQIAALRASAESSSSWKDESVESHGLQSLEHVVGKDGEEDEEHSIAATKALDMLYSMTDALSNDLKEDENKVVLAQQQQQSVIASLQGQLTKKNQQLKEFKERSLKLRRNSDNHQDCTLQLERAQRLAREEADSLQRKLAESEQSILSSNEKLQNTITKHEREIEALRAQLSQREKELSARQYDIAAIHETLSHREKELRTLAEELSQKGQQNHILSNQLSRNEQEVQILKGQLSHEQQDIASLIDQKEQQVLSLSDQLSQKEQEMHKLCDQLSLKEQDAHTLTGQLSQKDQDAHTLTGQLSQKDQAIHALTDQLSQKEQDIHALTDQLSQKEQDIHTLTDQLSQKEQDIHTLTDQLSQKEQYIHTLTDQLSQKEQDIHTLTYQLSQQVDQQSHIEQAAINPARSYLEDQLALEKQILLTSISEKEQEIATLTEQLSLKEQDKLVLKDQLTQREMDMESTADQLSQKAYHIENLTNKLNECEGDNAALMKQLSEREQLISALTAQLSSQTTFALSDQSRLSASPYPSLESQQTPATSNTSKCRSHQKLRPPKAAQPPGQLEAEEDHPSMVVYPHPIGRAGHVPLSATPESSRIFVAVMDYDPSSLCFTGRPDLELALPTGAIVEVHGEMNSQGYYEASFRGRRGLVPANIVQELDVQDPRAKRRLFNQTLPTSRPSSRPSSVCGSLRHVPPATPRKSPPQKDGYRVFIAEYDYSNEECNPECNELAFKEGNRIKVFGQETESGYFEAELDGRRGLVPARFLREASSVEEYLNEDRRFNSSSPTIHHIGP